MHMHYYPWELETYPPLYKTQHFSPIQTVEAGVGGSSAHYVFKRYTFFDSESKIAAV